MAGDDELFTTNSRTRTDIFQDNSTRNIILLSRYCIYTQAMLVKLKHLLSSKQTFHKRRFHHGLRDVTFRIITLMCNLDILRRTRVWGDIVSLFYKSGYFLSEILYSRRQLN